MGVRVTMPPHGRSGGGWHMVAGKCACRKRLLQVAEAVAAMVVAALGCKEQ